MNKNLIAAFVFLFVFGINPKAYSHLPVQADSVKISGKIISHKSLDGASVYLRTFGSPETVRYYKGQIKNNRFELNLSQQFLDTVISVRLFISSLPVMNNEVYVKNIRSLTLHDFYIDTTALFVELNDAAFRAKVKGGTFNRQKRKYDQVDSIYFAMNQQRRMDDEYKLTGDFYTDANSYRTLAYLDIVRQHPNSLLSVEKMAVLASLPMGGIDYRHREKIREALENLSPELQATDRVKKIYVTFEERLKRHAPKEGLNFFDAVAGLTVLDKDLKAHSFSKPEGKDYLLIDYWATWCGPCIAQHPALQKISEKHSKGSIQVIGISVDKERDRWKKYLAKHSFNYPQYWLDPADKKIIDVLGAAVLPTYTLIETSTGRVVEHNILFNDLEATLEKYRK